MSHVVETIPPGHPLQSSLQAIFARRGLAPSSIAALRGTLDRATLYAGPSSPALPLAGPLYLVHATAAPDGDAMQIMAVVSWSDQGLPRMAAGRLDDAISAGLTVALPTAGPTSTTTSAPSRPAEAPATRTTTQTEMGFEAAAADVPPWEAEPEPAPRNTRGKRASGASRPARGGRGAAESADSPHVDLSAEMAALAPHPAAPAPKAAPEPAGGGWAAAVAASAPPAAGARQSSAGSRRAPTASDLGFDIDGDPDLRRGDVLIHPRFGRCKVIKTADDKVKVRRASGAFIDLHLKVCRFTRLPDEDGRRVFDMRIGRG